MTYERQSMHLGDYSETMTARISQYFYTRQVRGHGGIIQRPGGNEVGLIHGILTKITIFIAMCSPLHFLAHVRPTIAQRAKFLSSAERHA